MPDPFGVLVGRTRASVKSGWREKKALIEHGGLAGIPQTYKFPQGGSITVILSVLDHQEQRGAIYEEVMNCGLFRTYKIQGQEEPRTHFLLHADATENTRQGYRYGVATMRAHPLSMLPEVQKLANHMQQLVEKYGLETAIANSGCAFWSTGIDVMFYRSGADSIGKHKDDNQGEQLVLTVIPYCPVQRLVVIESDDKLEKYELYLNAGDAYCMDGRMQQNYQHGVPKVTRKDDITHDRMAIVLRRGVQRVFKKDSGRLLADLSPRSTPIRVFGRLTGLEEGICYGAQMLKDLVAHRPFQCGVSGNKNEGCDSIIVASPPFWDYMYEFMYTATMRNGGYALMKSYQDGLPIRVFRSSKAIDKSVYAPTKVTKSSNTYRYDGLYNARYRGHFIEDDHILQVFAMTRVQKGQRSSENELTKAEFLAKCRVLGTLSPLACSIIRQDHFTGSARTSSKRRFSSLEEH